MILVFYSNAVVTELVDVLVSGTSFSNGVGVRVSPMVFHHSTNAYFYTNSCKYYSPVLFQFPSQSKVCVKCISYSYTNSISLLGSPNQHPNLFFPHILSTGLLFVSLSYRLNHPFLFVSVLVKNLCILD